MPEKIIAKRLEPVDWHAACDFVLEQGGGLVKPIGSGTPIYFRWIPAWAQTLLAERLAHNTVRMRTPGYPRVVRVYQKEDVEKICKMLGLSGIKYTNSLLPANVIEEL